MEIKFCIQILETPLKTLHESYSAPKRTTIAYFQSKDILHIAQVNRMLTLRNQHGKCGHTRDPWQRDDQCFTTEIDCSRTNSGVAQLEILNDVLFYWLFHHKKRYLLSFQSS